MDISDSCPEDSNSTDCLLRRLIELIQDYNNSENAQFNWDPIAFAFTAPIGTLATVLTLLAVFQAFLAAGTGRRKADRRAIGIWSSKTEKRWNWRNLNRLSYAKTPILRATTLSETLKHMEEIEKQPGAHEKE